MIKTTAFFFPLLTIVFLCGCSGKPSEKDINKKLLQEYVCGETARVNNLKIVRTEKTESTGNPPVFRYTVRGEVIWPEGCAETGATAISGKKEKFTKVVTLIKTEEGTWQ
ncbi:MAG TPA: hypothetical protein VM884_02440 [Flavisolibacter sp.]|nr:hypothetical protein [Flavisolibacter sp.]